VTAVDELLTHIPMAQLASRLGVDQQTAEQATRQALPALLSGMHANAQDPDGARSLANAIGQHDNGLLNGGVDVNQVDTADGSKIVQNVFGGNHGQVVDQLGAMGGTGGSDVMGKLLPMLAPIVMSYLAQRFNPSAGGTAAASGTAGSGGLGSGGLGGVLGGLLGGGGQAGGGLGEVLGGLLGQGRR
jgi:hypothetical protein